MSRSNILVLEKEPDRQTPNTAVPALLPWEDEAEFDELRLGFIEDFSPKGETEALLVSQLAWTQWRRRRLMVAERAVHMAALEERCREDRAAKQTSARALIHTEHKADKEDLRPALQSNSTSDAAELADTEEDEAMTRRAIAILETGDPKAYAEALEVLRDDTVAWWKENLEDDLRGYPDGEPAEGYHPFREDAESLLRFINEIVLDVFERSRRDVAIRPAIRLQAHGESLDPFRMDKILSLDERLTRQFEKTLGMLLRLQEMRAANDRSRAAP